MQSPDHQNAGMFVFYSIPKTTVKEATKKDDICVTNEMPSNICANFTEEQQILTRGSLTKKGNVFAQQKNKASRKGYKGEC